MKIATEELRKPLRIYTEQTSDVGGLWAFEPYAMFHVEFVEAGDYIAERNRSEALAAELIAARAKLEAAERLVEAVSHYRDFVLDHTLIGEIVPLITEPSRRLSQALAAFEAIK